MTTTPKADKGAASLIYFYYGDGVDGAPSGI